MRACTGLRLEWFGLVGWKVVEGAKAHSQTGSKSDPIPFVGPDHFSVGAPDWGVKVRARNYVLWSTKQTPTA